MQIIALAIVPGRQNNFQCNFNSLNCYSQNNKVAEKFAVKVQIVGQKMKIVGQPYLI